MHSLSSLHSFGFSSSALKLLTIDDANNLQTELCKLDNKVFYILGEGSNTVFLEDFQGTIINPALMGIELKHSDTHYLLKVGAGENWHQFVLWCMQRKIYGLENLALIPGTVGATPIQNIGAYGVEIEKFIHRVYFYNFREQIHTSLDAIACEFGYRDSIFKNKLTNNFVVTSVTFAIPKKWQAVKHYAGLHELVMPDATQIFNHVVKVRRDKLPDPTKIGNAGSFFKNPVITLGHYTQLQQSWPVIPHFKVNDKMIKIPAAWLIDQLGFKGMKIGGIACHPKQALVLTNDGSGSGFELLQLARVIKNAVHKEFSISLVNEVRLIGKNGPVIL